ncbi:iron-enterobactin transporter ATP-binding protein [Clostridia bacterium]|nr:iron-enterobactin transporter ATP-binding protein [Clostridia bacterium]
MIELSAVCGGYNGREALSGISIAFARGRISAVIGPNGSGKSTLVKTAGGQLAPYGGKVTLDGEDVYSMPRRRLAKKVSCLPQTRGIPDIIAETMVLHGRFPYLGYPRIYGARDKAAAVRAMERAGVLPLRSRKLSELSGGERQKVYIAMLLAQDTDAVFLDEPTTYLDIAHQFEVIGLIKQLRDRGKAVVMVLHDINQALTCADNISVMRDGRLLQTAAPAEIVSGGVLEQAFGVKAAAHETNSGTQYFFSRV